VFHMRVFPPDDRLGWIGLGSKRTCFFVYTIECLALKSPANNTALKKIILREEIQMSINTSAEHED